MDREEKGSAREGSHANVEGSQRRRQDSSSVDLERLAESTDEMMFGVYLGQGRFQINVIPINKITWTGDAFSFRMDARFGPNAAFTFDVKGTVSGNAVTGEVTPVGVAKAPFSRTFEGRLWANDK